MISFRTNSFINKSRYQGKRFWLIKNNPKIKPRHLCSKPICLLDLTSDFLLACVSFNHLLSHVCFLYFKTKINILHALSFLLWFVSLIVHFYSCVYIYHWVSKLIYSHIYCMLIQFASLAYVLQQYSTSKIDHEQQCELIFLVMSLDFAC